MPRGQERIAWQPAFRGIDLAAIEVDLPRPVKLWAARIDLRDPAIHLGLSPPELPAAGASPRQTATGEPAEASSRTTSTYLREAGCQLAFNGSAYDAVVDDEGAPQNVRGLWVVNGVRASPPQERYDVWAFERRKPMRFVHAPADVTDTANVLPGFELVLEGGRVDILNPDVAPRTAVGVSRDGATLVVLVADGRQKGVSEGLYLDELGGWMRRLGAHDALNLDGGGSSTLVIQDGDGARVLNRPIHRNQPGRERPSANHVCVRAAPLAAGR